MREINDDERHRPGAAYPPRQQVGGDLAAAQMVLLSAQVMDAPGIAEVSR